MNKARNIRMKKKHEMRVFEISKMIMAEYRDQKCQERKKEKKKERKKSLNIKEKKREERKIWTKKEKFYKKKGKRKN